MPRCRGAVPPAYPVDGGGTATCFLFAEGADGDSGAPDRRVT
jgi:hypothetical protein